MRVTGRPSIFVDVGGALRRADYIGPIGTATDALEFTYTVQAGDFDADGVALCASGLGCGSLQLNGGSIRGAADELEADLRLPALAAQSGHKVDAAEPLPVQPTVCADETRVPDDWPLKPSSITVGGKFRLMFLSSTTRNATSANIADYNSFVQGRAAAGHTAIRPYSTGFRALGSTVSYDARDNTCTTGPGVAIHWLNGSKVADNNADLYDGGWDDEANPRTEGGAFRSPRRFWSGSNQSGTEQIRESGKSAALGAPNGEGAGGCDSVMIGELNNASHDPLSVIYSCNTNSYPLIAVSQVFKVPLANEAARATAISIISSPASGDTYRLGETIEFEVTFSEAVAVRGAPQLALVMRDASDDAASEFRAGYVRSSGTTKLVFAHAVAAGDRAAGGIATGAGEPLQLNGATITAVADGLAAVSGLTASSYIQAEGSRSKVDGSLVPSVGVCDRTLQVRDAIVAAVSDATDCSQVTSAHLAAIEGTLTVQGLTSLNAGDFAGLTAVEILLLRRGAIETLPVGVFDELGSVRSLAIDNGLTHLPRDIFRGLGDTLTRLGLLHNELAAGGLPDGIFEELTKLTSLQLIGNPGADTFTTTADAGPGGTVSAGQTVTLGGPGNAGGPWGSNVTYEWTQTDGSDDAVSTVTLSASDVTNPGFTVPVLSAQTDVKLVLRVAGVGAFTAQHGTSTARILNPGAGADRVGGRVGANRGRDLPTGRDDRGRGELQRPGGGGGDAAACIVGRCEHAKRGLCPGHELEPAGVRIHRGGGRRRHRRHRGWPERPGAERRRDHERLRRPGDPDSYRAGCADGPQGGRVGRGADRRHLRAHAPSARQAGGPGQCERQQCHQLLGGGSRESESSGGADGDAQPERARRAQPHHRPKGRRFRRAHGDHESRAEQQPAARHPGRRVQPANGADVFGPERQRHCGGRRPDAPASGAVRPADRVGDARPEVERPGIAAAADLREADKSHAPVAEPQPRQRALRADRKGRSGWGVRRRLGRQRHPRGRWGGERLRRSLGRQRRV